MKFVILNLERYTKTSTFRAAYKVAEKTDKDDAKDDCEKHRRTLLLGEVDIYANLCREELAGHRRPDGKPLHQKSASGKTLSVKHFKENVEAMIKIVNKEKMEPLDVEAHATRKDVPVNTRVAAPLKPEKLSIEGLRNHVASLPARMTFVTNKKAQKVRSETCRAGPSTAEKPAKRRRTAATVGVRETPVGAVAAKRLWRLDNLALAVKIGTDADDNVLLRVQGEDHDVQRVAAA